MDLSKPQVETIFSAYSRYEIPAYQREYQWDQERWQGLWRDIGLLYLDITSGRKKLPPHFIGAIIVGQAPSQPGEPTVNSVIDGQQRLVTLSVLLAAIRDSIAEESGDAVVANHRLFWLRRENETIAGPRLEVQNVDRDALHSAMNGEWRDWYRHVYSKRALESHRVLYAYTYFRFLIWQGETSFRETEEFPPFRRYKANQQSLTAESLWETTLGDQGNGSKTPIDLPTLNTVVRDKLFLLNIIVEQSDEDGPTIFDTMNAKRTQLDQWDFIRNSLFIRLPVESRDAIFDEVWAPAQDALYRVSYTGLRAKGRDAFVYDYLIARGEAGKQGTINRNRGHEQLMSRISNQAKVGVPLVTFVAEDFLPAVHAWMCATGENTIGSGPAQRKLPLRARDSRDLTMALSAGPPIPVMLHYLDQWAHGRINDAALCDALTILETYVSRHVVCQTPMSPFRAHFMQIMADLAGSWDPNDLYRLLEPRWKTDHEVRSALQNDALYGALRPTQLGAIFRGLERELGGPGANTLPFGGASTEYSVEHVYPKSFDTSPNPAWAKDFELLGVGADEVAWLAASRHHIGNLTVLTNQANSKLKVAVFDRKRRAIAGQDTDNPIPPLAVNSDIIKARAWTRSVVEARTERLTAAFLSHWPTP